MIAKAKWKRILLLSIGPRWQHRSAQVRRMSEDEVCWEDNNDGGDTSGEDEALLWEEHEQIEDSLLFIDSAPLQVSIPVLKRAQPQGSDPKNKKVEHLLLITGILGSCNSTSNFSFSPTILLPQL